jgi:hypothetical protein
MTPAAGPAPPAAAATFRNLDYRAVGDADRRGRNRGAGGTGKAKCQDGADKHRPNHPVLPFAGMGLQRFSERARKISRNVPFGL